MWMAVRLHHVRMSLFSCIVCSKFAFTVWVPQHTTLHSYGQGKPIQRDHICKRKKTSNPHISLAGQIHRAPAELRHTLHQIRSRTQDLVGGRGGAPARVLGLLQTLGVAGLAVGVDRLSVTGALVNDVGLVDGFLLVTLWGL